ncbi:hypothetical protein [Actinosynnema pretiosum]|uniref:hypothetical protein n=1 Tax=Actinosynnema pretiosum TaxID=42197 RepID=UPI0012FE7184|nr:hypothetical protein [Actinosynnema pretiosum]
MIDTTTTVISLFMPVLAMFLRLLMRYLIERTRWRSSERLVQHCGPDVLLLLPHLARELRKHEISSTAGPRTRTRWWRRLGL